MDPNLKAGLFMMMGAVIAFAFARLGRFRDRRTDAEIADEKERAYQAARREERIFELERQMSVLSSQATPINAAYQAMLIAKLTHFHTPVMDALMTKLGPPSTLTVAETVELEAALQERIGDMGPQIDDEERVAASILLGVVEMARLEANRANELPQTETVLVTQPVPELKDPKVPKVDQ